MTHRRHPTLRWTFSVLAACLAAAWCVSMFTYVARDAGPWVVDLSWGAARVVKDPMYVKAIRDERTAEGSLLVTHRRKEPRWAYAHWLPDRALFPGGWIATVPLWMPGLLTAVPTFMLWRAEWKRRRDTTSCPACGYSLAGLPAPAACPECGERANKLERES